MDEDLAGARSARTAYAGSPPPRACAGVRLLNSTGMPCRAAIKAKHAYLYEHGRGLAIMRMIRTFIHGLRPGKFWATLNAATEIRLRPAGGSIGLSWQWWLGRECLVLPYADLAVMRARQTIQMRQSLALTMSTPAGAAQMKQFRSRFPSTQACLDMYARCRWSWRFWQPMSGALRWRGLGRGYGESLIYMAYAGAFAMFWPWITLALLGIFVQSRGRAKIRLGPHYWYDASSTVEMSQPLCGVVACWRSVSSKPVSTGRISKARFRKRSSYCC